jgi:hypothetical protein
MTSEVKNNFLHHIPLSFEALARLQKKGYRYLQVQGFTLDHHPEYVEPHYLMLVPIKDLSANGEKMGIYEDINSELIKEWAKTSDSKHRLEIFLAYRN